MNNIKRIIAAGLVGTAVISTGVMASAEETTQKTPQENLKAIMDANKVDAALQEKLLSFADTKTITADQASAVTTILNKLTDAYASHNYSKSVLKADAAAWTKFQLDAQDIPDALGLKGVQTAGGFDIYNKGDSSKPVASFTMKEFEGIITGTAEQKAAQISGLKANVIPEITKYMETPIADRTVVPVGPATGTDVPNPGYNQNPNDASQRILDELNKQQADANWTAQQKDDFNKAKEEVTAWMTGKTFTLKELQDAEALINSLPDGPQKDALLAAIKNLKETAVDPSGKTPQDALKATQTPAANDATSNGGTTAKTATNFGNVALAGAGLMTVAGAVFVISKKKIC